MVNEYLIDGISLVDGYNIGVLTSEGLDVIPEVKDRDEHDWPDESGTEIDPSTELRYRSLSVLLNCIISESSYSEAIKRINGLINHLSADGYHLLGSITRQMLYPVLYKGVTEYKRISKITNSTVILTFTLKFICPLPECRMGQAVVAANGEVSVDAGTGKEVNIWWGDGGYSKGTGAQTYLYETAGTYTVLIAGTGVVSSTFTVTGITLDEYAYPADGDTQQINLSPTTTEAYNKAVEAYNAAINSISSHEESTSAHSKENLTGLKKGDSPEFSDVILPALNSAAETGGEQSSGLFSWIASKIAPTAKSLKSHVNGILNHLYLRDGYLLKYTFPADTLDALTLNTDKFGNALNIVEGDELQITIRIPSWVANPTTLTNYILMRINGISSSVYFLQTTTNASSLSIYALCYGVYATIRMRIIGTDVVGNIFLHYKPTASTFAAVTHVFHTEGANISSISSLTFSLYQTLSKFPADAIIEIKKIA